MLLSQVRDLCRVLLSNWGFRLGCESHSFAVFSRHRHFSSRFLLFFFLFSWIVLLFFRLFFLFDFDGTFFFSELRIETGIWEEVERESEHY
jgi:hypothetical protein